MSLKIVLVLLVVTGLIGTAFGYFLRWIIALGRHGSMELEIKQMMLEAREEAKRSPKETRGTKREREKGATNRRPTYKKGGAFGQAPT